MTTHQHEIAHPVRISQQASTPEDRGPVTRPEPEIFDRYAHNIIAGNPRSYDALEVHGVRNFADGADDSAVYEVDNINPTSFSVYVHIKDGGLECVGDFTRYVDAEEYGAELALEYGWPVHNYVSDQHRKTGLAPLQ